MATYFKTDITGISWVSTAYLIVFSALLINFSKIADIFGRKKLFVIGLFVFGGASICCGLSSSLSMIIVFRIIQGVGAAILTPLAIPLAIELFGKNALAKLSVIVGMIISVSAASGPVLGGILNETFGFKSIFYVNVPFVLAALIFGSKYLKECYDRTIEKKVDFIGSILLAYGIGALTFFLVKGNNYGWGSKRIVALIITSAISLISFLIYEKNSKNPMIEMKLFKIKSFTSSIVIISVIFFAYMPISYLMNFYLEDTLGYSVLRAGLILGIVSVVSFVMSPIFAVVSNKLSSKVTSFLAVIFVTAGNLMFVFMNSTNNMKTVYGAFIVMGMGIGATSPLYQTAFEEISLDKNGIASGVLNSLRQLTACMAIALIATLSTHFTTTAVQNTKDKIVKEVSSNIVLEQKVKNSIISNIKASKGNTNSNFSKNSIHTMVMKQEKLVLAAVPAKMQSVVIKKFNIQEKEIYRVLADTKKIKNDETYKVYNKCFLIIGLISILGLIAVPFNSKKKSAVNKNTLQKAA
jgi:EmrB/QacA subfamily drug resistance transporter